MATPQQPAELEAALAAAATVLAAAKRVVVLTGAGVSAESGIATFRGERSSVWSGVTGAVGLAVYGTPFGWGIAPGLGWKVFVKHFYAPIARAQPNAAHRALADLAGVRRRKATTIVTQNVDGLHQAAGSAPETVHEIHGSVRRFRCVAHGHPVTPPPEALEVGGPVPYCTAEGCRSALRPDAVLFTENLPGQGASIAVGPLERGLEEGGGEGGGGWTRSGPMNVVGGTRRPHRRRRLRAQGMGDGQGCIGFGPRVDPCAGSARWPAPL